MIERLYVLEEADANIVLGHNQENLITLKNQFPKLKILFHRNIFKILGDREETEKFVILLKKIEKYSSKYNRLNEKELLDIIKGESLSKQNGEAKNSKVIVYGVSGKAISPRGANQDLLVKSFDKNDLTFAIGPAGSGKTFVAIALAVKALKNREIRRIILSRPAVEAGEKLGFLPGEMKDKLDPYLQPLYDALEEMIPVYKLKDYMDNGVVQIAPLAFMRGRTLSDAVIILDEAQNTSKQQMKMFLTRLGENSKMIITGDTSQVDLPKGVDSGLKHAVELLDGIEGIGIVRLKEKDIVRHPIVAKIVNKYSKEEERENKNEHK